MISVEEKLSVFTQYLLRKQRDFGKKTIGTAKDKRQELIAEADQKLAEEKRSIEERTYHVIFRDKNKIIAQGKNTAKTQVLELKSKILEDFKLTILDEAKGYVGSDLYKNYLKSCISKTPQIIGAREGLIIFTKENDRALVEAYAQDVLKDYTLSFDVLPADTIGGIVVRDKDNRISCDFTVENLIRENYKFIGMRLNEVMEEQVG